MRRGIILSILVLAVSPVLAQKDIYIDPQYSGPNKRGTMAEPFNSWSDLVWRNGYSYFLKRNSLLEVNYQLRPTASYITIGAYGDGNRPLIKSSVPNGQKVLDLAKLSHVVVKDLEIESTNNATTCISLMYSDNATIENCVLHGAEWGMRNLSSSGLFSIKNCEIYMTGDDGCYNQDVDSIELTGTSIHDVNQKYFINKDEHFSGGDCFQMVNVKYFHIYRNILDHGITGNKFCIITASGGPKKIIAHGIIENNLLTRKGGILIYLADADSVIIRNNRLENADIAIYNHSNSPEICFNEFVNIGGHVFMMGGPEGSLTKIFNNTFVNFQDLSNNYKDAVSLTNNIFSGCNGTLFASGTNPKADYNCYYHIKNLGSFNIGTHSIKTDPMFKDSSRMDFTLKGESPCLRNGSNISSSNLKGKAEFNIGAHGIEMDKTASFPEKKEKK